MSTYFVSFITIPVHRGCGSERSRAVVAAGELDLRAMGVWHDAGLDDRDFGSRAVRDGSNLGFRIAPNPDISS